MQLPDKSHYAIGVSVVDSSLVIKLRGPYGSLLVEKMSAVAEQLQVLGTITNLRGIVLDFGDVPWIGDGFLQKLDGAINRMARHGLRIVLCGLNDVCISEIQAKGIDRLFRICESLEAACTALSCGSNRTGVVGLAHRDRGICSNCSLGRSAEMT